MQVHILSGALHVRLVGGKKKMKVLLIEDSKFQRTANGRALTRAGYDVVYAANGEEGLGAARENIPDLNFARYDVTQNIRTRCPSGS